MIVNERSFIKRGGESWAAGTGQETTMTRADGLQVVLGANGGTGRAITDELVRQGRRVRAVVRRPSSNLPAAVEQVTADLYDVEAATRAIAGAAVVHHAAQPPYAEWTGNFDRLNDSIARATGAAGARLVFADNLYLYGPGGSPMTELTPVRATDRKGSLRAAMARDLLDRHARGEVEVAIGRSSDYFGPFGTNSGMGDRVFAAALAGKAASWVGRLDQPHSLSYLPDLARALVTLGDRDEAAGRAWHLPVTDALTGREHLTAVFEALGQAPRIRVDGPAMVRIGGLFIPMVREVGVVLYQWTEPWVSDWSAFEAAFGPFERTPLAEAYATTLDWWRGAATGARNTATGARDTATRKAAA
jgi:nucleoside-diphosphate-sugar epimerase